MNIIPKMNVCLILKADVHNFSSADIAQETFFGLSSATTGFVLSVLRNYFNGYVGAHDLQSPDAVIAFPIFCHHLS